ncbi:MAG: carbohydrate porin [Terriglobia bacterium]
MAGIRAFMIGKRAGWRWAEFGWLGAMLLLVAMAIPAARGQDSSTPDTVQGATDSTAPDPQSWNIHMQSTVVGQGHPSFLAEYTGLNSLTPGASVRETVSVDVMGGVRLWRGGEFFGDVLMWQGYGLNNSLGVAGFPNAEAYRIGKTYPDFYLCRAYIRETIGFGGEKEAADGGLGGTKDVRNLTLTLGHLSAKDIFDTNAYSNDGRTQFMNWVLVANGAWDYPADTLGFTNGAAAELNTRAWTGRLGIFQVSKVANGIRLDWNLAHAWSAVAEVERRYSPRGHAGALRLLAYDARAHMGSYQDTLNNPSLGEVIVLTAAYRYKYGFGINLEQEIRKNLGAFVRLGWNDGKNQTYEFTDVDRTATAGLALKGARWRRPQDTVGVAVIVNGISAVHRQYLAAGGLGITVGDGALDYRAEHIVEAYYNWKIAKHFQLTPDYQRALDPAYNHARGPVDLLALRFHTEF